MAIYKVGEGTVVTSPCSSTILAYIHNVPGPLPPILFLYSVACQHCLSNYVFSKYFGLISVQ